MFNLTLCTNLTRKKEASQILKKDLNEPPGAKLDNFTFY